MGGEDSVSEWRLREDEELRLEVSDGAEAVVELVEGRAEVFGAELIRHKKYAWPAGARIAVFTWHGCCVEVAGVGKDSIYVARKTPMPIYINTHAALEQLRQTAASQALANPAVRGPRILIAGPTDVGKSTYARLLLNYAARMHRQPVFVDLDPGQNSICIPGTLAAAFIQRVGDPVEGIQVEKPLVYHLGGNSPSHNIPHLELLIEELAETVTSKCKAQAEANFSGLVINTCGWVKEGGYGVLVKAAELLEVDVVVVVDHERLYTQLQRDLPGFVKISHQPKSGGVEPRSREARTAARKKAIRRYFYGSPQRPLHPFRVEMAWEDMDIWKVGGEPIPESCLPLGMKPEDHRTKVVPVAASEQLLNHVLGLCSVPKEDPKLAVSPVKGFVVVLAVDAEAKSFTLLSPQPHPLPTNLFSYSAVTYIDD